MPTMQNCGNNFYSRRRRRRRVDSRVGCTHTAGALQRRQHANVCNTRRRRLTTLKNYAKSM